MSSLFLILAGVFFVVPFIAIFVFDISPISFSIALFLSLVLFFTAMIVYEKEYRDDCLTAGGVVYINQCVKEKPIELEIK